MSRGFKVPGATFRGERISYVDMAPVKEGVVCAVFEYPDDNERDLGIVSVESGYSTPVQEMALGDLTLEQYLAGTGTLIVKAASGEINTYDYPNPNSPKSVEVRVGDTMQWIADSGSYVSFAEDCYPPYTEDRFVTSQTNLR